MSILDTIDAAFDDALAKAAKPFRLDLTDEQIEEIRAADKLEPFIGKVMAAGAYREVNVYSAKSDARLLAQPGNTFKAIAFPLRA